MRGAWVAVGLLLAACGGGSTSSSGDDLSVADGPDLAVDDEPDFSAAVPSDLSSVNADAKTYAIATPHDVDVNAGGSFGKGVAVSMTGLIVLAPPYGFAVNSQKDCRYEVWAQDLACSTPPCGIILETAAITNPNGTGMFCPYAKDTTTALVATWAGDVVSATGVVDTSASTMGSSTVVQHSVTLDSLTISATKQTLPTPIAVVDSATSIFTPYSGSGWAMYEGTYIKLSPTSGKFTTTLAVVTSGGKNCGSFNSNGGFSVMPGGANFSDTFNTFYVPDGGVVNCWPPNNSMYSAIAGVVDATFGASILPVQESDFVP